MITTKTPLKEMCHEDMAQEATFMLRNVGKALWQLEDPHNLSCPLRELREEIEQMIDEDLRTVYKEVRQP